MGNWGLITGVIALLAAGALTVAAGPPPKDAPPGIETVKGKDGAPMILIPAGPFTMGSSAQNISSNLMRITSISMK
jgi:formylglycine-generating enzyme required for sulfatase activity